MADEQGAPVEGQELEGSTLVTQETEQVNETAQPPLEGKAPDSTDGKPEDGPVWDASGLIAPEGQELDTNALEAFVPMAKEMNLTLEQSQQLINFHGEQVKLINEKIESDWDNAQQEWVNESMQDPEIGGRNLQETVSNAKMALNTFGNVQVKQILEESGLGNNVEILRMLSKIGKLVSNDQFDFGRAQTQPRPNTTALLYPTMQ